MFRKRKSAVEGDSKKSCGILIFASRSKGCIATLTTVFLLKLGAFAKQNINKRAFLHWLFCILFYTGRTATFLTISTMPGLQENHRNFKVLTITFGQYLNLTSSPIV